jgi:THUMP domain-like
MTDKLASWQWIATPEGTKVVSSVSVSPSTSEIAKLRRSYSSEQVAVAIELSRAKVKILKKFDPKDSERVISDLAGIEMASSSIASHYKARRYRDAFGDGARIGDLCCGIGADSVGLKDSGLVPIGVDIDPVRVWMYEHNLALGSHGCETVTGDAVDDCPEDIAAFHLDPARRTVSGKRSFDLEDFVPCPQAWERLLQVHDSGAIKLNPGVDAYNLMAGECEIISESGRLTQAILWVGQLEGDHERRATLLGSDGSVVSVVGEPERPEDTSVIGSFVGSLDPSLERADLVGTVLDKLGVSLVYPGTGMVTCDVVVEHPMVRWHRVIEVVSWSRKRVKSVLRGLDSGIVEVRTRGGVVNTDVEQKQLRGKGSNHGLTVFVYRIGDRTQAIVCERVKAGKNPQSSDTLRAKPYLGHEGVV